MTAGETMTTFWTLQSIFFNKSSAGSKWQQPALQVKIETDFSLSFFTNNYRISRVSEVA